MLIMVFLFYKGFFMRIGCAFLTLVLFFSELNSSIIHDNVVGYKEAVIEAARSQEKFYIFRQNSAIINMYEHVSQDLGRQFSSKIIRLFPMLMENISKLLENDRLGSPKMEYYEQIGLASGTTLRYIFFLGEIIDLFDIENGCKIIEIGCGYGGQCSIISKIIDFSSYKLIDLDFVLPLIDRYLTTIGVRNFQTLNPSQCSENEEYDLFISNYGFSECSRHEQDQYIEKVIRYAKKGYITYNLVANKLIGTYSVKEFCQKLREVGIDAKFKFETIQTNPSNPNYLIYWGVKGA